MMNLLCDPSVNIINYLDSSLRVETLSFQEAADFNPQEWFIWFMTFSLGWRTLP
jgi:hypothetical protein